MGNGHPSKQPPELFIIPHRQQHMSRDDSVLLVISRSITSQLKYLHQLKSQHIRFRPHNKSAI